MGIEDEANKKEIAPLLRFFSSESENEYQSFDGYISNMKPKQKSIYYLTADSVSSASKSPVLEKVQGKGYEVLFMVEPLDEITIQDITKEGIDIFADDDEKDDGDDSDKEKNKEEK